MTAMIFWGEKGEYEPFTAQKDGWPNAGEVIRHYRKKLQISADELARQYGEAIGEQITTRWLLKMEQQNKIPTDLTRPPRWRYFTGDNSYSYAPNQATYLRHLGDLISQGLVFRVMNGLRQASMRPLANHQ